MAAIDRRAVLGNQLRVARVPVVFARARCREFSTMTFLCSRPKPVTLGTLAFLTACNAAND